MRMSLVIPLYADFDAAARAEWDLKSFFGKFPMEAELLWVVDPPLTKAGKAWVAGISPSGDASMASGWPAGFSRKVLVNKTRLGRGASVKRGLDEASGELLCVLSADLSVPLSEIFTGLRLILNDPENTMDLIVGERSERKRQGPDLRPRRKAFFDAIELEKAAALKHPQQSAEPTSPFFIIRRELWQKISPNIQLRSWYYTPRIIAKALEYRAGLISVAVSHSTSSKSHQRWWESLFG